MGRVQAEVRGAHEGSVWAASWHPAGHLLATGAADGATKFWCRARPGDPFYEHQLAAQDELAAMSAAAGEGWGELLGGDTLGLRSKGAEEGV